MTGLFAEWQPRYAERGIPTFPVREKRPAIRGYLKLGSATSARLAKKFPDADAIGFTLGKRSKITVLDVDTPDETVLADALNQYGQIRDLLDRGFGKTTQFIDGDENAGPINGHLRVTFVTPDGREVEDLDETIK